MIYNGDANEQDLVSLLNDYTGQDNYSYTLNAKTRNMNQANREIWTWIHEAYGGWMYDDSNNTTDFPTATTPLILNQQDYVLPSSALTVRGVEVKLQGSNVWTRIFPKTEEQIRDDIMAEKQFMSTPSQPRFYVPYANSIKLYPAANYAQTASLRVSYERETVAFTPASTTQTPGFNALFHEAVAVGAATKYANFKTLRNKNDLLNEWADYKSRITKHYQERYQQLFPPKWTVNDSVQESM